MIDQESLIEEKLFRNVMKSNWKEVIGLYKNNPEAWKANITGSGDTALHIAISDGQEYTVEELVKLVDIDALKIENGVGNTPLHLAAYLGNRNMCRCIAALDPTLIRIRYEDKETPLYLAVLHGRKDAFLSLNSLCKDSQNRYGYYRGKDGDTILHSAIDGEYFEIAFHIIRDCENLLNSVNEKGFSPLDILASKPSAFRSGSHIRPFHQLIYHCIFVDEINLDASDPLAEGLEYNHHNPKYPENYQTCVGIFLFTRNILRVLLGRSGKQHGEESQKVQPQPAVPEQGQSGQMHDEESQKVGQQLAEHEQGTIFRETDKDGNSALHLGAMMSSHRPWLIPGAALQMQWEIKWYLYVKKSMPINYFVRHNIRGQTPSETFTEDHLKLVDDAGKWLKETSQSCSLVASLIATVAFATSATVPGGVTEGRGTPTLQNEAAFIIFALSSLVALSFSVTSVVMFLIILTSTSRYQGKDFGKGLPNLLLSGLTFLFVSIGSMLLSFCAGHFFVLKEKLKYVAFPMYAETCFPVTFFAIAQFRLYIDLFKVTIRSLPQSRCR